MSRISSTKIAPVSLTLGDAAHVELPTDSQQIPNKRSETRGRRKHEEKKKRGEEQKKKRREEEMRRRKRKSAAESRIVAKKGIDRRRKDENMRREKKIRKNPRKYRNRGETVNGVGFSMVLCMGLTAGVGFGCISGSWGKIEKNISKFCNQVVCDASGAL